VHVEGLDRFWSFKSELRLPLAHIASVERAADEARTWWHGIRAPGTQVPGLITAGTYYESEGRVFWDVHDPEGAVALHLHDERFVKLVIEVENPAETIAAIEAAFAVRAV
jgi:hypothetical protein